MASTKPSSETTKPAQPVPAKSSGTRKVSEWAKLKFPKLTLKHSEQNHVNAWQHAAASALHCWPQHLYHAGKEMELSEADYDAAIKAATEIQAGKPGKVVNDRVARDPKKTRRKITGATPTTYVPHKPALSPHNKAGIKNEKPED